ncbi:leucine-rich repeat-containing protein 24 [Microplitis demolitor]|uniref:leucine-rich repeat-containing protein 24 n=1 Tax=Microplitis demolitor TaxID=69319 RepID=UPI0004CDC5C9|nr:leucine-rich repeat-containing protein 24 [Microplitis demolitor]
MEVRLTRISAMPRREHCSLASIGVLLLLLIILLGRVCYVIGDKCADECTCKWKGGKRTVECVKRLLTSIPDEIDPETQVLDASDNDIKLLPSNIFIRVSLTNLQRVYLRNCRMEKIDNDALNGLTNLIELDLSNNRLTSVPSLSLAKAPFLRDLSLANNPLIRIQSNVFRTTSNLIKLDLSNAQISEIESNGLRGLESLETLKLNGNRLLTLNPGTFEPLNKLTSIELHDNPWICNCHLREMKQWLVKHNLPTLISPICHGPEQLINKPFIDLTIDDFACRPVLMITSRYAEATIGENASIVCRVSAVPPAKIKWYWNSKLLTNQTSFSSYQKIYIYEEGQFSKRSTLILTNAQETDSSDFFCVAENRAGSVEANFTLHVSVRTAGMSTLGSGQIAGISAALVVLILIILLIILVLFVRLRRMPVKDVKTNAANAMEILPSDTSNHDTNNSTMGNTLSRKVDQQENETTFNDGIIISSSTKPPGSLSLSYVQRVPLDSSREYIIDEHPVIHGARFSSTASLVPIENPDLIRDTRTSIEELGNYTSDTLMSGLMVDDTRLLYSSLWDTRERTNATGTSNTNNSNSTYAGKDIVQSTVSSMSSIEHQQLHHQQQQQQFPPGAKQLRVWQKGVPVLPPVSALKRVLGSTRSSPDEGYQEGTGTDV